MCGLRQTAVGVDVAGVEDNRCGRIAAQQFFNEPDRALVTQANVD
jgi:hypothetical protein